MQVKNEAILISGGVDSTALAYLRRPTHGFVVDYGQLAADAEVTAATEICKELGIQVEVIRADCRSTGSGIMAGGDSISQSPSPEWWPFRNQLLATLSATAAIKKNIRTLLFASVKSDDFHADGRREFYAALDNLISLQEGGIKVEAPALDLSSVELVKQSKVPATILGWTHSCHTGDFACGQCRGCYKRNGVLRDCGFTLG